MQVDTTTLTKTETDTITITIDGVEVKTTKGKRILEAALDNGIYIPNLCALLDIKLPTGACRLCQVQIEGRRGTITACSEPAAEFTATHLRLTNCGARYWRLCWPGTPAFALPATAGNAVSLETYACDWWA
jgi:ferredoxin